MIKRQRPASMTLRAIPAGIWMFVFTLAILTPLRFSHAVEYQSPRTLSLGGAGRGYPFLNDSIYLNPSFGSFSPIYSLAAGYNWFDKGRNYNVSIEDSRTELFQAGVGYTKREQNVAFNVGASKQVIDRLGVGIGAKYIIDNTGGTTTTDFMYSTSYLVSSYFYSSFIVDNILQTSQEKLRNLYRTIYLGMKFVPSKTIGIFLDPFYSPDYSAGKKAGYSIGAEFALLADFYFRMGAFQNAEVTYLNSRGNGFALGGGYIGPKVRLDYALHRVTSSDLHTGLVTSNSLEMTVFF